ncbi:APC family permease [Clostridium peptidivorans]|uniref:APC family permease n=1 Tax=Clostridium peptidivorans TaxID=100174 RepID=UPI000BE3224A|nr:amino acid permease [Clostridium peptidivorans]
MKKDIVLKKELGLFMATALVAGNMIGSGILMLPASLASISGPGSTILAWIFTGLGSIFLALSFARLGTKIPKTGGPYEYSKLAFGGFVGFMNAWLYWTASWIGNAAIITSIASYTGSLFPIVKTNGTVAFLYTSLILWIFTILNIKGVRLAGIFQSFTTIFKLVLFIFFICISAWHFDIANITPMFPVNAGIETLPAAAAITLWAFSGFETSTINAGEIKNPERNIKLSTVLGISITVILYLLISVTAMGAMSQDGLKASAAPIIDIMAQYLGIGITKIILVAAIVSVFGSAVGWILTTARMSYAAGKDNIFPKVFGRVHPKYNTPHMSLIINTVLTNVLLFMNYSGSLLSAFNFMVLLSALAYLPVYACTTLADILFLYKEEGSFNKAKFIKSSVVPLIGLGYSIWAICGSGKEVILYGCLLMLLGVPFYLYSKIKNKYKDETNLKVCKETEEQVI